MSEEQKHEIARRAAAAILYMEILDSSKIPAIGKIIIDAIGEVDTFPADMHAVEYQIDGYGIEIRRCPEFISIIGNRPAYWYIARYLGRDEDPLAWKIGLRKMYWTKEGWRIHTPIQYTTPEDAYHAFKIKDSKSS